MFRSLVLGSKTIVRQSVSGSKVMSRGFAELTIPTDEQQGGRRRQEIDAAAVGIAAFNRDPIVPPNNAGTKENPILVPSGNHSRVVGYEDPVTHAVVWFNMNAGKLHYVPDIGLYFKIKELH